MKITKSRLLQIIREEVELHENNLEENTFELDEETMDLLAKLPTSDRDSVQDPNDVDDGEAFSGEADQDGNNKALCLKSIAPLLMEGGEKRISCRR